MASTDPRKRMCDGRIASRDSSSVDRLLELTYRAEQSHFWFRGFRQYMKPALARATAGVASAAHPRLRLRHRLEPGDAAARTAAPSGSI